MAIAESPREPGVIWAGSNDGQVQVTRDGGRTWTNTTTEYSTTLPLWRHGSAASTRRDTAPAPRT